MLIIDSKDCENIDKALKKYKKKFEKSKVLLQLRDRQSFTKPSVRRRGEVLKAIYKQNIASGKIEYASIVNPIIRFLHRISSIRKKVFF